MSQIFPFLSLPYDVRRDIYTFALDYPDLDAIFARIQAENSAVEAEHYKTKLPACVLRKPHVSSHLKTTPGIMLCNRQTASEAREAMRSKTFTLKQTPPSAHTARPMDITEFISEETLRDIRRVHFIMDLGGSPHAWLKTMENLLDVWSVENHLERIDVTVEQSRYLPPGQLWERGSAIRMLSMVQSFAKEAGIELTGTPLPDPCVNKWPLD